MLTWCHSTGNTVSPSDIRSGDTWAVFPFQTLKFFILTTVFLKNCVIPIEIKNDNNFRASCFI